MGFKERVYQASPVWIQNLGVSAVGWSIRRQRFGRQFQEVSAEFADRQWQPATALADYQNERLRLLIRHAFDNVPHYRRVMDGLKLRPDDFRTAQDLPKLPVLTRDVFKTDPDSFRARNVSRRSLLRGETSGTTGSPMSVYWDKQVVVVNAVVEWRQKNWTGLKRGDRISTLMLSRAAIPQRQARPPFWRFNRPMNQLLLSALHMRPENLPHYIAALRRFRPAALEAYPSAACLLARYLLDRGEELPLRCVLTTSETWQRSQRDLIERAFCCHVFDYYGMAERVVFGTECEAHSGLHLNTDYGITEVVDDAFNPVGPGISGRIVGTSLHSLGMPLIRYATTDMAAVRQQQCSCGRAFPLLAGFEGRSDDMVVTPDGRMIPSTALTSALDRIPGISECQIIQGEREHIVVEVVRGLSYTEADTRQLLEQLRILLGQRLRIDVQFVTEIERSSAGKFRWVISKVPVVS